MFLQEMSGHEHVVTLLDVLKADNDKDIYLVFEFLETDLHAAIRANVLQDVHKRYIVYQTLKALKYMHSAELLHRDMKPANLLLNADCHMKVADFGLARSLREVQLAAADADAPVLTDYVGDCGVGGRDPARLDAVHVRRRHVVVGCILAELTLKPAFPGASTTISSRRSSSSPASPTPPRSPRSAPTTPPRWSPSSHLRPPSPRRALRPSASPARPTTQWT